MADGAYLTFVAKVDAFVHQAHAGQSSFLQCGYGCDGCCRVRRSAYTVEIDTIRQYVSALPQERQDALQIRRETLDASGESRCVFLEDDGGCAVYPARPLICRTHGPAVLLPDSQLAWCELNFVGLEPSNVLAQIDAGTILDVNLLNQTLAIINAQYIDGDDRPARTPLAEALDPVCL